MFRHKAAEDLWSPVPPTLWLSKGFRKRASHRFPVQPGTVLLQDLGCRTGCVKRHRLNQKENSVNTQPGKRNSR